MPAKPLQQVGIALAVPLTWDNFRARAETSDWLSKYFDRDLNAYDLDLYLRERWENEYLPLVVEPLTEVVEVAWQGGATVHTCATLDEIQSITREKQIAILFAHWKGPEVVFEDLREQNTTAPYLARLQALDDELPVWLRSQLSRAHGDPSTVVKVLNESLHFSGEKRSGRGDTIVLQHCVTRDAAVREELDALFEGLLRPGNRLELYDGLHTKEELEEAIGPDFDGVLDLTLCTSTVPADYIAARRHHTMRTVQFPKEIEFVWAAKCIAGTLNLFSSGNFEYQEAREMATGILKSEMQKFMNSYDYEPKKRSQQHGW